MRSLEKRQVFSRTAPPACPAWAAPVTGVEFEKVWDGTSEQAGQAPILSSVSVAREAR